jgi:copper chaperone CopZ
MQTITYTIPNISCGHCIHTIETEVSEIAGVKSVEGDQNSKKVTIIFDNPANEIQIKELLKEIDYPPNA